MLVAGDHHDQSEKNPSSAFGRGFPSQVCHWLGVTNVRVGLHKNCHWVRGHLGFDYYLIFEGSVRYSRCIIYTVARIYSLSICEFSIPNPHLTWGAPVFARMFCWDGCDGHRVFACLVFAVFSKILTSDGQRGSHRARSQRWHPHLNIYLRHNVFFVNLLDIPTLPQFVPEI